MYRDPEILLGQKEYSTPFDIWTIGLIFYEMVHRKSLFTEDREIYQIYNILLMYGRHYETNLVCYY